MCASRPLATTPIVAVPIFPREPGCCRKVAASERRTAEAINYGRFQCTLAAQSPVLLRAVRAATEANVLPRLVGVIIRGVSASGNLKVIHDRSQHISSDASQAA